MGMGVRKLLGMFQVILLAVLLVGCDFRQQQTEQVQDRSGYNETLVKQSSQSLDALADSDQQAVNIDSHPGKALHDANCISCHDTGKYESSARQVNGFPALLAQVRRCNANLNPGLSDDEIKQVADYLNQAFYGATGMRKSGL